jgi:hypothetical protein
MKVISDEPPIAVNNLSLLVSISLCVALSITALQIKVSFSDGHHYRLAADFLSGLGRRSIPARFRAPVTTQR